jgi:crossover junction endodeoxyribonuclease RuvC
VIIAGIDPGIGGAVAFLDPADFAGLEVVDMPVLVLARNKRAVDTHAIAALLARPLDHVFLESASARPGQGTVSMFGYGRSLGVVEGVIATHGIPCTEVPPAKWKRTLGVPAAKDGSRARASQLLPVSAHLWQLKKSHGRAEAALLALYGARQLYNLPAPPGIPASETTPILAALRDG